jgi:hypothetical protein
VTARGSRKSYADTCEKEGQKYKHVVAERATQIRAKSTYAVPALTMHTRHRSSRSGMLLDASGELALTMHTHHRSSRSGEVLDASALLHCDG